MSRATVKIIARRGTTFSGVLMEDTALYKEGDRVVCDGRVPCGSCRNCRRGDIADCENAAWFGRDFFDSDEGIAEIEESNVYALPDNIEYERAVYAGMCAEAIAALEKIVRKSMFSLAVCGSGESGSILAQMAKRSGAGKIYYFTADEQQVRSLKEKGINAFTFPENAAERADFINDTAGKLNAAIEASGDNDTAMALMDNIAGGGVLVLAGNTVSRSGGLDFKDARDFFFRICSIETSKPAAGYFEEALEALEQGYVEV